jgi:hypothetical protein
MSDFPPTSDNIRAAGKAALRRRKKLKEIQRTDTPVILAPPAEHYHLIYTHPETGTVSPDFLTIYDDQKLAFTAIRRIADKAEPNVEYYEDGQVGFETTVHGRSGLFWMLVGVGVCSRARCAQYKPRIALVIPPKDEEAPRGYGIE